MASRLFTKYVDGSELSYISRSGVSLFTVSTLSLAFTAIVRLRGKGFNRPESERYERTMQNFFRTVRGPERTSLRSTHRYLL